MPFSSEIAFVAALSSGMNPFHALFFASFGNILAIILNYLLGFFFYEKMHTKLQNSLGGRKGLALIQNYRYLLLPLSWLPVVGDPLTIIAGISKTNFILFLFIAGGLRVGRYYMILTLT